MASLENNTDSPSRVEPSSTIALEVKFFVATASALHSLNDGMDCVRGSYSSPVLLVQAWGADPARLGRCRLMIER